jgi:hypothetical protein
MQMKLETLLIGAESELAKRPFASPFLALLFAAEVSEERRIEVCSWLVESGCLYLVVSEGHGGSQSWVDSITMENMRVYKFKGIPDSRRVGAVCLGMVAPLEMLKFAEREAVHPIQGKLLIVKISLNRKRT